MADIEKVMKGLKAHADGCGYRNHHCDDMDCPYRYGDESCDIEEMCRDALELLKEKEANYPSWQNGKMHCGHCGSKFPPRVMMRFCHRCGVPIKLKVNDIVEQEGR